MAQKPLELILARNFLTSLSTPAFLVDRAGALLFYNEAAGALLGTSFEESGRMPAEKWSQLFGPLRRRRQADTDRRESQHQGAPQGPPRSRALQGALGAG